MKGPFGDRAFLHCDIVTILVVILYYSAERHCNGKKWDVGYLRYLCIIPYNGISIENDLN